MESDELKNRLSYNIKRLRKSLKLSQEQLAEKAGVSKDTINSIEGRRVWPSEKTLMLICNALSSDAYSLFLPQADAANVNEQLYKELQTMFASFVKTVVNRTMDEMISPTAQNT